MGGKVQVRILPSDDSLSGYEVVAGISNRGHFEEAKCSVLIRRPIDDLKNSKAVIEAAWAEASAQFDAICSVVFEGDDEADAPNDHLGYVAGVDVQKDGEIGITVIDAGTFIASEDSEDEATA